MLEKIAKFCENPAVIWFAIGLNFAIAMSELFAGRIGGALLHFSVCAFLYITSRIVD